MKLFIFIILSVSIYFTTDTQAASIFQYPNKLEKSSLLTFVAIKCVQLSRTVSSETLVNSCGGCRIVAVARKRSGISMPILRSFNVHPNVPYTLPFKGPGRSRITTIQNCQSDEVDAKDAKKLNPGNELGKCVVLKQMFNGSAVIINECSTCRGAAVQRTNQNGQLINRQAYKLRPKQSIVVKSNGATQLGLIAEIPCPS